MNEVNKVKQIVPVLFKMEHNEDTNEISKKIEDAVESYLDKTPDYYLAITAAVFACLTKDIDGESTKLMLVDFAQRVLDCQSHLKHLSVLN